MYACWTLIVAVRQYVFLYVPIDLEDIQPAKCVCFIMFYHMLPSMSVMFTKCSG
jgi:hypothetical protein